jgi:hypothetical protein
LEVRTGSVEPLVSDGLVDNVEELTLFHASPAGS